MKDPTPARIVTLRRLGLTEESATPSDFETVPVGLEIDPDHEPATAATPQHPAAVQLQKAIADARPTLSSDKENADSASNPITWARSASRELRDTTDEIEGPLASAIRPQFKNSPLDGAQPVEVRDKKTNTFMKFYPPYRRNPFQTNTGLGIALRLTKMLLVINGGATITTTVLLGVANSGALSTTPLASTLLSSIDDFVIGLSFAVLVAILSYGVQIIGFEFPSWPYAEKSLHATGCAALVLSIISFTEFESGALSMIKVLNLADVHDAVVSVSVPIPPISTAQGVSAR